MKEEIQLIGSVVCYNMLYGMFAYDRVEEDGEVTWFDEGERDYEYRIDDEELENSLEQHFQNNIKLECDKNFMSRVLTDDRCLTIFHDIMNLGMTLRQDQLNGTAISSGNQALELFIESEKEKFKCE